MPSWKSINGVWEPAEERTYDKYKDEIYQGKDRAALDVLNEEGVETLGMPVNQDPQILEIAQRMGLSVDDYLKRYAPSEKQKKEQEIAHSKIVDHQPQPKKKPVKTVSGGVTITGGFGDIPK